MRSRSRWTAGRDVEPLGIAGRVVRQRWPVAAVVRLESEHSPGPYPLTTLRVTVENVTDWAETDVPRDEAMRRSLVAVHTLLHSDDARFISLLEPPEFARAAVDACTNEGTFPVLIGDPDDPTTVLSSPIILYDHPAVAAESPGDMCDATEIDEILALRILTLTDDEKRLARSTDPRAAAIVDRIEGFSPDVFASLHGEMRPIGDGTAAADVLPWWEPAVDAEVNPWEDAIVIAGVSVSKGSKVRLQPGRVGRSSHRRAGPVPRGAGGHGGRGVLRRRRRAARRRHPRRRPGRRPPPGEGPLHVLPPRRSGAVRMSTVVAGIGNIFNRDDGFGSEVAQGLLQRPAPPDVRVEDYGIRGMHLALDLLDGCELLVLIDALAGDEPPGTGHPPRA